MSLPYACRATRRCYTQRKTHVTRGSSCQMFSVDGASDFEVDAGVFESTMLGLCFGAASSMLDSSPLAVCHRVITV